MSKARIFIATPAYEGKVTLNYHVSCLRALRDLPKAGIELMFNCQGGDGLIGRSRAVMVSEFLGTDCTHLMFIDSDIGFEPEYINHLLEADQEIVCGLYRKRQTELSFPFRPLKETLMIRGAMQVKYAPTGFMLIRRSAIEKLIAAYPERRCQLGEGGWWSQSNRFGYDLFPTPIDNEGVYLSEDYGFCDLWQKIGGNVWMMPHMTLIHSGPCDFVGCVKDSGIFKFEERPEQAGVAA